MAGGRRLLARRHALGLVVVLALIVPVGVLLISRAGRFVVAEDRFSYAETALVLSGDPLHRALAARDLYRQGRVGRILIIPEPLDPAEDELIKLGLPPPRLLAERILVASGVPQSKFQFLPDAADGTIVEALRVREFLVGQLPPRLAVITSQFASRRACFIFRWVLHEVEILCAPTPYDRFDPERWWSRPRHALYVVMEYQKFITNVVVLALGLQGV